VTGTVISRGRARRGATIREKGSGDAIVAFMRTLSDGYMP
jgi:hypothetical protein